jgi:hypothetical protein
MINFVKKTALVAMILYGAGYCIYHTNEIVPKLIKFMDLIYG